MHPYRRFLPFALLLCLALILTTACSDSDDDPGTTDTTAPTVVGLDPTDGESDVSVDDPILITFSEPMDETSHAGHVTLTGGTLGAVTWDDARTLRIGHADFAEGVEVTVTLAAGFADAAGNTMDAPVSFSFWTETTAFVVLWTSPAHLDEDVERNSSIVVQFSQRPQMGTLADHVTLADVDLKAEWAVTITQIGEMQVRVDPDDDLDASTVYELTLDAGTAADGGATLGADHVVRFTTGTESDTTPPQLLSIEPAGGSTMDRDQGFLRMTFSEAIDTYAFEPSELSAQLQLVMRGEEPTWSGGGTVLTVPLVTPLPDGVTFEVVFDSFRDINGNVNAAGFSWDATVEGTPDHFPVLDDLAFFYAGWAIYDGPMAKASESYESLVYYEWESGSDENFRRYELWNEFDPPTNWEYMRKTSSGIRFRGFHESEPSKVGVDIWFTPEVDYLRHPMNPQTWSGSADIGPDGGDTYALTYEVRILPGTEDVPMDFNKGRRTWGKADMNTYWNECRTAILEHEIRDGGTLMEVGIDTLTFAPGVGLVKEASSFEDSLEGTSEWSRSMLVGLDLLEPGR